MPNTHTHTHTQVLSRMLRNRYCVEETSVGIELRDHIFTVRQTHENVYECNSILYHFYVDKNLAVLIRMWCLMILKY